MTWFFLEQAYMGLEILTQYDAIYIEHRVWSSDAWKVIESITQNTWLQNDLLYHSLRLVHVGGHLLVFNLNIQSGFNLKLQNSSESSEIPKLFKCFFSNTNWFLYSSVQSKKPLICLWQDFQSFLREMLIAKTSCSTLLKPAIILQAITNIWG